MHLNPPPGGLRNAVVLLLLICCLVCFPLVAEVLCLSLFCCALPCVLSSFAIILKRKERAVWFAFTTGVLLLQFSVILPHDAVGWSAVCDYGIS